MPVQDGANGGQQNPSRGRPPGRSDDHERRGWIANRQRDAGVPDAVALLVADQSTGDEAFELKPDVLRKKLDRWEEPYREEVGTRDSRTRKLAAHAWRRLRPAMERAQADGFDDPMKDPRVLRSMIDAWEAMAAVWEAEDGGEAAKAWMPYDDPLAALHEEIQRTRGLIAELEESARQAQRAERAKVLPGLRKRYTRTADIGRANPDGRDRVDPDSPEYRDIMLAHASPEQREALEALWEEMQSEDDARRKTDAWGRMRVPLPDQL